MVRHNAHLTRTLDKTEPSAGKDDFSVVVNLLRGRFSGGSLLERRLFALAVAPSF
jgi:hypothetical protein